MRKRVLSSLWGLGVAAGLGLFASPALATVTVTIDPEGDATAPLAVTSLDWNVGNALAVGGVTAINQFVAGAGSTDFTALTQARLSLFNLDGGGTAFLGAGDEWTLVAAIPERVTNVLGGPLPGSPQVALFGLGTTGANFIKIYHDTTPDANNLAGTGFDDGDLVLEAEIYFNFSNFTAYAPTGNMDQFGTDNYPLIDSIQGAGASQLEANITYVDTAYFTDPSWLDTSLKITLFTTQQILPFTQVDPSHIFSSTGMTNGNGDTIPKLGTINGITGPDIQFQGDANQSFDVISIPEPVSASLSLLGMGALALAASRRRKA